MSRSPRPAVAHRGDAGVVTAELAVLLPTVVVLLLVAAVIWGKGFEDLIPPLPLMGFILT